MLEIKNIFREIPAGLQSELFEPLVSSQNVKIERIVSSGQSSPENFWYDQEQNEFVIVLQGRAKLEFGDGSIGELGAGEYINIPAHQKHRVAWTDPKKETVWLVVYYS